MEFTANHRIILSLCKSGSTALIHSLAHAPNVTCYLQTIKSGVRTAGRPDYRVYSRRHEGVVISKETIGHSSHADCTLAVFPSEDAIAATAPVFLLRDPVDTWASWSRAGWGSVELFEIAQSHLYALVDRARAVCKRAALIRYEAFGEDREAAFRHLCEELGIAYTDDMLKWRFRFPEESPVIWAADVQRDFEGGSAEAVRQSSGFEYRKTDYDPPAGEVRRIRRRFQDRYEGLTDR